MKLVNHHIRNISRVNTSAAVNMMYKVSYEITIITQHYMSLNYIRITDDNGEFICFRSITDGKDRRNAKPIKPSLLK